MLADKAYSSRANRANRAWLRSRGIRAVIPNKADQLAHRRAKGRRGGRPPAFDPVAYRARHAVLASRPLDIHRGIKPAVREETTVQIATINIWLRHS